MTDNKEWEKTVTYITIVDAKDNPIFKVITTSEGIHTKSLICSEYDHVSVGVVRKKYIII